MLQLLENVDGCLSHGIAERIKGVGGGGGGGGEGG